MRAIALATAISLSFALVPASAEESGLSKTYKQGQSVPVQQDQTPQQSDQSRAPERSSGEGVQINRDWKAQDSGNATDANRDTAGKTDDDHQTVGRDWRTHPKGEDNH